MTQQLTLQQDIAASPADVFAAISETSAVQRWFAEAADISLPDKRYDFWGRFTPEIPSRENGRHPILKAIPDEQLQFGWQLSGQETAVKYLLKPHEKGTRMQLQWSLRSTPAKGELNPLGWEDFWFLSFENLRRFIDGRSIVRCDFTAIRPGEISLSVDIDGPADEVFDVLINPAQLERWIASKATVEPEEGGEYDFGWEMPGSIKILALEPNKRLQTSWAAWGDFPPTVVTWTLAESKGKTRLTLVHSGFAPDQEAGEWLGWINFMGRIRSIVEYGDAWQTAVHPVSQEMKSYYAATILQAQQQISVWPSGD